MSLDAGRHLTKDGSEEWAFDGMEGKKGSESDKWMSELRFTELISMHELPISRYSIEAR